jgi:hypothetical protein
LRLVSQTICIIATNGQETSDSIILISQGVISIREVQNNSLISLLSLDSNTCPEVLSGTIIRFTNGNGTRSAINFLNNQSLEFLLQTFRRNGIQYFNRTESTIARLVGPQDAEELIDCNGNFLQEYFLNSLHTKGYDTFVSQIEDWLKAYRSKLESSYSSQGKTTEQDESTYEQQDDDTDQGF